MARNISLEKLQLEAKTFQNNFQSVILSTVSVKGQPEASYAPFVNDEEGAMYIFTSELAAHTRNLLYHPRAGLLFIENEENSKNPFARKRLSLQCVVTEVERLSEDWTTILDKFEDTLGKTINLLKNMPDFHLFRFDIIGGSFVKGFGQAYSLRGNDLQILERRRR